MSSSIYEEMYEILSDYREDDEDWLFDPDLEGVILEMTVERKLLHPSN